MARFIHDRDSAPIIDAAKEWVRKCLIQDGSVLSDEQLWTAANLDALNTYFVQRLDTGSGSFYEKLKEQLADAPDSAKRLMAEMLWALFLFPSNISIETKRNSVIEVWSWSGKALDPTHPMLSDSVLNGIGSGGMGIMNHRWRELVYMIGMGRQIKATKAAAREDAFASYEKFVRWIDTVPQDGHRQFRQMFRYLLFPQRVERMSANRDRRKVLAGFGIAKANELRKWTDVELDTALLRLRQEMEAKYDTKDLDFYDSPLRERWKSENEPDETSEVEDSTERSVEDDGSNNYTPSGEIDLLPELRHHIPLATVRADKCGGDELRSNVRFG